MLLHRVLPSTKERYCFTIWVDGLNVNKDEDVLLTRDKLRFTSWEEAEKSFCDFAASTCHWPSSLPHRVPTEFDGMCWGDKGRKTYVTAA